jgi:hypothetical protein
LSDDGKQLESVADQFGLRRLYPRNRLFSGSGAGQRVAWRFSVLRFTLLSQLSLCRGAVSLRLVLFSRVLRVGPAV